MDLATPAGAQVRAVAAGRVSFAGRVAGRGVVSVELAGTDLRTTYEPVTATVKKGAEVEPGGVVGTVEITGSHCPTACVHWGLLRGETYLDPLALLPPWLLNRGPSRLLPVLAAPAFQRRGELRAQPPPAAQTKLNPEPPAKPYSPQPP